jgi:hypothetical protein
LHEARAAVGLGRNVAVPAKDPPAGSPDERESVLDRRVAAHEPALVGACDGLAQDGKGAAPEELVHWQGLEIELGEAGVHGSLLFRVPVSACTRLECYLRAPAAMKIVAPPRPS